MVYNPNIPQGSDLISASASPIQTNFAAANTQFGVDHQAFDSGTPNGHHKKVFFDAAVSPVPAPAGTESAIYPLTVSGVIQAIFKNATTTEQITGTVFGAGGNGSLNLPSGFQIRWGQFTAASSPFTNSYSTPFTTSTWSVILQPIGNAATNAITGNSPNGFTLISNPAGTVYYYIAIGH